MPPPTRWPCALAAAGAPYRRCETLERAVQTAAARARPGDTVLLSPACASFDQFRDYEHRGDRFRELARQAAQPGQSPNGRCDKGVTG